MTGRTREEHVADLDRPLRIGVLGAASSAARALFEPAQSPHHVVTIVGDRNPMRAQRFARDLGIPSAVPGLVAVVEAPDVDVVFNALPSSQQASWSIRALRAGKAVLSDQTLGSCAVEVREVMTAADAAGRPVLDGHHWSYHPVFRAFQRTIVDGSIGPLLSLTAHLTMPRRPDGRLGPPARQGSIFDLGSCGLDAFRQITAALATSVRIEQAVTLPAPTSGRVDIQAEVTVRLGTSAVGRIVCSTGAERVESTLAAVGTYGSARVHNLLQPHLDDRLTTVTTGGEVTQLFGKSPTSHVHQLMALAELCSLPGTGSTSDGRDPAGTMRLVDDAYQAAGWNPRCGHREGHRPPARRPGRST